MIHRALANFSCVQVGCGCADVLVFGRARFPIQSAKCEAMRGDQSTEEKVMKMVLFVHWPTDAYYL